MDFKMRFSKRRICHISKEAMKEFSKKFGEEEPKDYKTNHEFIKIADTKHYYIWMTGACIPEIQKRTGFLFPYFVDKYVRVETKDIFEKIWRGQY